MRRSRKKMLEGQESKSVQVYSKRLTLRVPNFIHDYVKHTVQVSGISRNRWLSDAVIAFGKRISSPEGSVPLTEHQINEDAYSLIKGTYIPFTMQRDKSLPLLFTEAAQYTANSIVRRYSTQLTEGESLPKDIKSKLILIILLDYMLRHSTQGKVSSVA